MKGEQGTRLPERDHRGQWHMSGNENGYPRFYGYVSGASPILNGPKLVITAICRSRGRVNGDICCYAQLNALVTYASKYRLTIGLCLGGRV